MAMNSGNKRAMEYSPFGEKSKEATTRRFKKRKSSKSLMDMFERESISMQQESDAATNSSLNPEISFTESPPNPDFRPQLNRRFTTAMSGVNLKPVEMECAQGKSNNGMSQISPPLDWDDSAARSSFDDSPFIMSSMEALNKRINSVYPVDFSHLNGVCASTKGKPMSAECVKSTSMQLPRDLRLGTKLRLVSDRPFPWLEKISTPGQYPVDISPGDFAQAMNLSIGANNKAREQSIIISEPPGSASALVCLQTAAIFHQFPSIGSVQLFPRRNVASKSSLKSANLQSIEPTFMDNLNRSWVDAFGFLFRRWLGGHLKSFYLCSPQFTILFINLPSKMDKNGTPSKTPQKRAAANSPRKPIPNLSRTPLKSSTNRNKCSSTSFASPWKNGKSPLKIAAISTTPTPIDGPTPICFRPSIVVTPTTTGFRQTLQKNGVHFSIPFKAEFVDLSKEECPKDFLPTDEDGTAELDHDEWLRDIGISPKTTLRLKRSASELDAPSIEGGESSITCGGTSSHVPAEIFARRSGGTPPTDAARSTILIRGARDAEALCRLLVDQPNLIGTKTGPQTGLPPTLISPSPFRHSTQNELVMASQVVKKAGQTKYVLELENGPIIPSAVDLLFDFAKKIQSNRVQIQLSGRNQCNGMNEALDRDMVGEREKGTSTLVNFNEFEWNGTQFEYA